MERVITSLDTPLIMRHCTVAPLSAGVTFSMVMMDGLGPKDVSGDVVLARDVFSVIPNWLDVAPVTPGRLAMFHTSPPASVVLQ